MIDLMEPPAGLEPGLLITKYQVSVYAIDSVLDVYHIQVGDFGPDRPSPIRRHSPTMEFGSPIRHHSPGQAAVGRID